MAVSAALPTLSQVQAMDTTHLREASAYWTRTANLWEEVFSEVHKRVWAPGGTPWTGRAAAAAEQRFARDLVKVRAACDRLHQAAAIARRGDEALRACQEAVLEAVCDARAEGFEVGEDYSVADRASGGSAEFRAARVAAAQGHASFIRHRVGALVAKDHEIATQIAAATQGIDTLTFEEAPGIDDTIVDADKHDGIQLVDNHTWKQDPTPPPPPRPGPATGPSTNDIRRVLDKLPQGDQPWIREVRSPEDLQNLWNWMTQNGVDNPTRYGDPGKGEWKDLPDGTGIGQRYVARSTQQPALDIRLPGKDGSVKVHINPDRGGVPDIPPLTRPALPEATLPRPAVEPPSVARPPVEPVPGRAGPETPMAGGGRGRGGITGTEGGGGIGPNIGGAGPLIGGGHALESPYPGAEPP
jgi:hypothetical protein